MEVVQDLQQFFLQLLKAKNQKILKEYTEHGNTGPCGILADRS